MAVLFSPWGNQQFSNDDGNPAVGWKIYTYAAGSSTPLATYTTSAGTVAQANPIVLSALGFVDNPIWLTSGLAYKLVLTNASDVVKGPPEDNITGVTGAASVSQWQASGLAPTYISATSFTLAGDQTVAFHVGRKLQSTNGSGTVYSTISATAYGALTTVTVTSDSGVLDSSLSAVNYGLLTATNPSVPSTYARSGANADITSLTLTIFNAPQKRQTVLSGAAVRVAIGTGLAVNLLATTTPIRISFAGGTGAQGSIDRISTLSADASAFWSGLTANVVNYLFYDRNTTTGVVTGVASVLPYIANDSSVAISVANGQHTYVYDTGQMYVGNGSVATAVDRTAEGECLAGAATITTVTSYARQGKFKAPMGTTIANGTRMSFNHNVGIGQVKVRHVTQFVNASATFSIGDQVDLAGVVAAATLTPAFTPSTDRLTVGAIGTTSSISVVQKTASSYSTIALTDANYAPIVERDF